MQTWIVVCGSYLMALMPAAAGFSEFVVLTEEAEKKHELFKPLIFAEDEQDGASPVKVVVMCHYFTHREFTRVDTNRRLENGEMNFRKAVWGARRKELDPPWGSEDGFPDYVVEAEPVAYAPGIGKPDLGFGLVSFEVPRKRLDRCYLFLGFEEHIFDGGYYYGYRLDAFKIRSKAEANQEIDAFMRQYRLHKKAIVPQSLLGLPAEHAEVARMMKLPGIRLRSETSVRKPIYEEDGAEVGEKVERRERFEALGGRLVFEMASMVVARKGRLREQAPKVGFVSWEAGESQEYRVVLPHGLWLGQSSGEAMNRLKEAFGRIEGDHRDGKGAGYISLQEGLGGAPIRVHLKDEEVFRVEFRR